ncbi:MAG: ATP-binding cassette domain-containing protein [Berryella intestinalis]|uniref:ABC transporter ATP-binding protein n=1 Tax=Berryella intestinalis TaxID=1531429 RepID=UPI002A760594|nr:ATP-binding cassette domain-containing protein [Berryella intestinalis]MDY3129569.1 ATP-binding cassette domain-containing protein [Berryella intestinalis]
MALEACGITFGYPQGGPVLYRDFSLSVEPSERVALDAPSGAGKTTLCRLLAGYERPLSGHVAVDGEPLPKRGVCPVQLIGQHPEHALDPRMRMELSLREAGEVPADAIDALGIKGEWLRRFPHELSGGELQRFCIARAVAVHPRYLIADEISTMLDAVTQAEIWRYLLEAVAREGMGLVFVSHSPDRAARIATRSVDLSAQA